jgi:hypothetical protein
MKLRWSTLALALIPALATTAHAAAPLLEPAEAPTSEVGFADFNNDGKADMVVRIFATGDLRVSYNLGDRFNPTPNWIGYGRSAPDGVNWDTLFADIDGDGRTDSIDRLRSDGQLCVHYNNGSDFAAGAPCYSGFNRASPRWRTLLAPIDGDARADMVSIDQQTGTVYVHRNNGAGFDTTPLFTQTGLAVASYPTGDWQQFVADCTGDGRADFLNLAQSSNWFVCHPYDTQSGTFEPVGPLSFLGPPEIYERELVFAQFDASGSADILSHDLRTGDLVALPVLSDSTGLYTGHRALLRDRTLPYMRPAAQQPLPVENNRPITTLMWYGDDHAEGTGRPVSAGWFSLYPEAPGPMPSWAGNGEYRSDTPILGTYASAATETIRQHAYWLRAAGIDVMLPEVTNCSYDIPLAQHPTDPVQLQNEVYCDAIRTALASYASVLSGIRDFAPPRMMVGMRIPKNGNQNEDYVGATRVADDLYAIYQTNPGVWYTYNDGSANKDKPMLLVFAELGLPAWQVVPQWTDSRFNIRYTNGYLNWLGLTSAGASAYFLNDRPYWSFVENEVDTGRPGYFRYVHRRMPTDTTQIEQASAWTALWLGQTNWLGQQEECDLPGCAGKVTFERMMDPLQTKAPRNAIVGTFNYPVASKGVEQEGQSTDESQYIEPSVFTGWKVYDKASSEIYTLRKQRKGAPGKPIVTYRDNATHKVVFQSANYPTQYCTSVTSTCPETNWMYLDVRTVCPKQEVRTKTLPEGSPVTGNFYLRTRNPFGDSEAVLVSGDIGGSTVAGCTP